MPRVIFFEDHHAPQFTPIALFRPVIELRCGHFSVRERVLQWSKPSAWGALLRPSLAGIYQEEHPTAQINSEIFSHQKPTIFINGRWLSTFQDFESIEFGRSGWCQDELAWVACDEDEISPLNADYESDQLLQFALSKIKTEVSGKMLHFPWDLISENPRQLSEDFAARQHEKRGKIAEHAGVVGSPEQIFIHPTAELDPFVVLDSRHGPIWIDEGAKIQAFTRIEGPAFIGRETQTFRANIREGTSIGPVCRVGGEIEESIIHSHANKYHDGFLGHSYVCPWVNLGALTTNSDLKNDYSNVSVPLAGQGIKANSNKVGCFIGDHTKTALCSLFNTGSSIGAMCLILPGGELLPKHIPSFSRIWHGDLQELPDGTDSAIQTAEYAMGRRGETLTPAMKQFIQNLFLETQAERDKALARYH